MGFPSDLRGKSVLDIGSFDGFFAFEAERRGAERVLAVDRHPVDHRGFAIARELLGSKADYRISSVYDLSPQTHGVFDVVLFLGVLYHLRHPILAIEKIHSVCKEYLFLETHVLDTWFLHDGKRYNLSDLNPMLAESSIMQFYPADELNQDLSNWFAPSVRCVEMMLSTSGFRPRLAGCWADRASFIAEREEFVAPFWY
jgi:tRNA (mo5U34)-methyltransferase